MGCKYAIALAGTVALDLALYGLSIGLNNGGRKEDEVIVTPRSFIASVSTIVNAGATPIFVDVDQETQNITPENIAKAVTSKTKAIICVHLAGWPCEMYQIKKIINNTGIKIIEDCAQAHGAKYKGKSVGSFGDVAAWSFCQDKIITTAGEGGMVTCNNENLWRKMWAFKDHGKSFNAVYERTRKSGFNWVHESFGTNWRLTEMQSVVGILQLKKIDKWTKLRARNAKVLYKSLLKLSHEDGPIRLPKLNFSNLKEDNWHANYKFYVFVRKNNLRDGWSRLKIIEEINNNGVPCFHGSCSEIYLERAFDQTNFRPSKRLKTAKELGETSIMFNVHPSLKKDEMNLMAEIILEVLKKASKN